MRLEYGVLLPTGLLCVRRIPGTIVYGVQNKNSHNSSSSKWAAIAQCDDRAI